MPRPQTAEGLGPGANALKSLGPAKETNDRIVLSEADAATQASPVLSGDGAALLPGQRGGNDRILVDLDGERSVYGDAETLGDGSRGGNDKITATGGFSGLISGDGGAAGEGASGGNDEIVVDVDGTGGNIRVSGDFVGDVSGTTRGGNDVITGPGDLDPLSAILFEAYGDTTGNMSGSSEGGDDVILGADGTFNVLYGDAFLIADTAVAGDDLLIGGDNSATSLYGDAAFIQGAEALMGDDTLIAGQGSSTTLYGDVFFGDDLYACYGNDTLVGGTGEDTMFGDAAGGALNGGADTFVFLQGGGEDVIADFRQADGDVIDVSDYGFLGIDDLGITTEAFGTFVDLGGGNMILLSGVTDPLTADDFVF